MRLTPSAATTRCGRTRRRRAFIFTRLKSRSGILSPLATQATGLPLFKTAELREALDDPDTDVVHFHNISLVGGPGVLGLGTNRRAVRIMTAHEHWLICPMHLLWKYDREPCDGPELRELLLEGGPAAAGLAVVIGDRARAAQPRRARFPEPPRPGRASAPRHRRARAPGPRPLFPARRLVGRNRGRSRRETLDRPYLAAAGRLVKMKGFQRLIPLMRYLPEVDLRIAGTGPYEPALRAMAADLPNVRFDGLLGGPALARLFRNARAVVVPSLFPETFGYVVLEAFSVGTPVVVHEGGGALYETGFLSGGGLAYRTDSELLTALRRMVHDRALHDELAARGFAMRMGPWSETEHLDQYLALVGQGRAGASASRSPVRIPSTVASRPRRRDEGISSNGPRRRRGEDGRHESPARIDLGEERPPLLHPRWRPAGAVPVVVLVALACVCFARLVAHPAALIVDGERPSIDHANPGEPRGVGNDATFSFLPHHLSIARVIRTFGHLPLWDDRGFGGRPLAGNPQAGMFYPPVWLVWWSGAPAALGWLTVGHLLWGGLGMYVLMRSFPLGRWAATVAAAIYQASPFLLAHTFEGHYPHVWAACWYPWAFWAYRPASRRPAPRAVALARHPRPHLLDGPSSGVVSPGAGAHGLEPL